MQFPNPSFDRPEVFITRIIATSIFLGSGREFTQSGHNDLIKHVCTSKSFVIALLSAFWIGRSAAIRNDDITKRGRSTLKISEKWFESTANK